MNVPRSGRRAVLGGVLLLVLVLGLASPVGAIPAFARKYGRSCQTCHVAFPKLNAFGEAFRLLGYHLPGETADQIAQPDVRLGSPAYKRVWPEAVWPSLLPSHVPVALSATFLETSSKKFGEDGDVTVRDDFVFPSEASIVVGGSTGDHISFFGELAFEQSVVDGELENDAGIEHFDIRFIRPVGNSTALNAKIGAFQPELVGGFDHGRRLTIANIDAMYSVAPVALGGAREVITGDEDGGGGLALPGIVRGVELFGVVAHRLLWCAGVVNGIGPGEDTFDANAAKDVYGRVAWKWGGMSLDGVERGDYAASGKSWQEKSLRVGLFGYRGNGRGKLTTAEQPGGAGPLLLQDGRFDRVGVDASVVYEDLNVFGGWVRGTDHVEAFAPISGSPDEPGAAVPTAWGSYTYRAWFLESDMVLHVPWLVGVVRYENVDFPGADGAGGRGSWERATASVTGLVRANVKAVAEYTRDLDEGRNHSFQLALVIAI